MIAFVLQAVGAAVVLRIAFQLCSFVYRRLVSGTSLRSYGAGSGYWAIVTGASDGIGKAYAVELGKRGFNVFLVGRSKAKLDDTKKEVEATSKASTQSFSLDLSSAAIDEWKSFAEAVARLGTVGVLVNNAGVSSEYPEFFLETPQQRHREIVAVNCNAVNEVTAAVLPMLLKNKDHQKRGLIINVGSFTGFVPTPLLAVYAASKSYVMSFSTALAAEYGRDGIDVENTAPAYVASKMSKQRPSMIVPTPEAYVTASLGQIGKHGPFPYTPFLLHNVFTMLLRLVPQAWVLSKNFSVHRDIRRRVLEKKKREAGK